MKSKIIIAIGILLIIISTVIFIIPKNGSEDIKNDNKKNDNIVKVENLDLSKFSTSNTFKEQLYYSDKITFKDVLINDYDISNKDAFIFAIPKDVNEIETYSFYEKKYSGKIEEITIKNYKSDEYDDNYNKIIIDNTSKYNKDKNINVRTYETNLSGYKITYAIYEMFNQQYKSYDELIIIYVNNDSNNIIATYKINGYVLSDKDLESVLNGFMINKGNAKYTDSNNVNGKQISTIHVISNIEEKIINGKTEYSWRNKPVSYDINYVVNNSYVKLNDVINEDTNFISLTDNNNKFELTVSVKTYKTSFENYILSSKNTESKILDKGTVKINNRNYFKLLYSYEDNVYLVYGTDDKDGIKVEFLFKFKQEKDIDKNVIEKLLNYTIKSNKK